MANGDESAIAMLEEELGYGDAPIVPTTEEELAKEEARVAEDARTQAAVDRRWRRLRQHWNSFGI